MFVETKLSSLHRLVYVIRFQSGREPLNLKKAFMDAPTVFAGMKHQGVSFSGFCTVSEKGTIMSSRSLLRGLFGIL